jgi:hypothetical protein
MPLKYKVKAKEEIPADQQALYVEREGAWYLDVEGAADKGKLDEFRANNLTLARERDELKKRFEGIDPEEVRKLAEEKRRLEEAAQLKAGEFDKVLAARLQAAKGEHDKQLAAVTGERDALHTRLSAIQIDQAVVTEASKRGLRASAIPDITARARGAFRLVDGSPTPFEADGKTVRAGKDGVAPMNLAEWVDTLVSDAPHLFEANAGGGSGGATSQYGTPGGAGSSSYTGRNPFRKESWNLTEQMKLEKTNPALAARLRASQ